MRKTLSVLAVCAMAVLVFAACANNTQSSSSQTVSIPVSVSVNSQATLPPSTPQSTTPAANTADIAANLVVAANLGNTFNVTETDLSLSGVSVENIVEFTGLESQLSSENGGIVIVIYAQDGAAETLATQMEAFRDARMGNADYEEFANARANTAEARIKVFGNYVVYAASATGHEGGWDALDAAIDEAFA